VAVDSLLTVRGLRKQYAPRQGLSFARRQADGVVAVEGLDLDIAQGETLGLVGESGSGKSTAAYCILQLTQATSGSVAFEGHELTRLGQRELRGVRRRMQVVFQDPYAALNPRRTIEDILREPLRIHGIGTESEQRRRVRELSDRVGIDPRHLTRRPHEFSGGQRQRIVIARALALEPVLLICDEPVSALDVSVQAQILNLLMDLRDELRLGMLFIAHDLAVVRLMSDRVMVMRDGRIVEHGTAEQVYAAPRHEYTRSLLASVPAADPRKAARRVMTVDGRP
jgi:ABC-type oligopeptide transport system ATPase subunit